MRSVEREEVRYVCLPTYSYVGDALLMCILELYSLFLLLVLYHVFFVLAWVFVKRLLGEFVAFLLDVFFACWFEWMSVGESFWLAVCSFHLT